MPLARLATQPASLIQRSSKVFDKRSTSTQRRRGGQPPAGVGPATAVLRQSLAEAYADFMAAEVNHMMRCRREPRWLPCRMTRVPGAAAVIAADRSAPTQWD
jgi:hypothetical protein